jgi:hypothetical protein
LFFGLFDRYEEGAGECFEGQGVGAGHLDEFAELCGFLCSEFFGFFLECLEFGIEVAWFACQFPDPAAVVGRPA